MVFDALRRYLEYQGYDVTFVQNFTDIDDKMIARANEEGITVKELGDRFIEEYFKDATALGVRPPPCIRGPLSISKIIDIVQSSSTKGIAYQVGSDVYYDTSKFSGYGKLSARTLKIWSRARGEWAWVTISEAPPTLSSGRGKARRTDAGKPRRAWAVPAGISSAAP